MLRSADRMVVRLSTTQVNPRNTDLELRAFSGFWRAAATSCNSALNTKIEAEKMAVVGGWSEERAVNDEISEMFTEDKVSEWPGTAHAMLQLRSYWLVGNDEYLHCNIALFCLDFCSQLIPAMKDSVEGDLSKAKVVKFQTKVVAGVMYRLHVATNDETEATHVVTVYRAPGADLDFQSCEKL